LHKSINKCKNSHQLELIWWRTRRWSVCRLPQYFVKVEESYLSATECIWD